MNAKLKPTIVEETAAKRSHILQSTQNQERGGGGDKGAGENGKTQPRKGST